MILDNNLVMAKNVFRGYEDEFDQKVNGYQKGDTVSIRRPADFTVRDGATMAVQDVIEGKTSIVVNKQKGVDFRFTSNQLTLSIDELSDRVIKPAMVQLANQIDVDCMSLYSSVPQWVGTAGQTINSFADFFLGPQQLNQFAAPVDERSAVLSPIDHGGLLGSQTALFITEAAKGAYRDSDLGRLAQVDTYMSQNVPTLTCGSRSGSVILVNASILTSTTTYDSVKDTMTQSLPIDGFGGATQTVKAGEVFTIAGVYAVNPVTKAPLPFLKQFVNTADATASGSAATLTISPPLIWTGAQKNVDVQGVTDINNQALVFVGTASTAYQQNIVFHKNAFALVMVPMIKPPGAVDVTRQSYRGASVRLIPTYDGTNDTSAWRLDVLYGIKTLDGRLATRLSGT